MFKVNYYGSEKNEIARETIDCVTKEAATEIASIQVYDNWYKNGYRYFVVRDSDGRIVSDGSRSRSEVRFF